MKHGTISVNKCHALVISKEKKGCGGGVINKREICFKGQML